MARLRQNFQEGTITDNPLAIAGTTLNSAELAGLIAVAGPDILAVTLDPTGANGAPEIVHITAHTAAATSATILRAQEGTVARAHPVNTEWEHNITEDDFTYSNLSGLPTLGVAVEDEGAAEGQADTLDFAGDGVSVGYAAGTATVTIPGASVTEAAVLVVGGLVHPGPLVAGQYYAPAPSAAPSAAAASRSLIYLMPFYLPPCTIDRIACEVTTGVASVTGRLGIYTDNGAGRPSALGVDGGTFDASTNGLKEVTVSYAHSTGLLWLAFQVTGGGSNPSVRQHLHYSQLIPNNVGTALTFITNGYSAFLASNAGAFPNPVTITGETFGVVPRLAIRAA